MKKIGYILGRRVKGDVILGTDPITNAPGRIIAPAVPITESDQFYNEQSAVPNYTIGSRMVVDERTYHYARASLAISNVGTYRLAVSRDQILAINDLLSAAPAKVVGDTTVVVTVAAFQGGVVAADELVGGYIEIWPVAGGNQFMWRRIIANTAVAAGLVTITVDRPFNFAVGLLSQVTVHPSIYRATVSAFDAGLAGYAVAVGLPPVPVTINWYYWLQTWGPCFIAPTGVWPLGALNFVDVYFHSDGCINSSLGEAIGAGNSPQRVGYALGAGNYGSGEVMLQLAP